MNIEEIYQKLRSDKDFIKTLIDELSHSPEFVNKIAEVLKPELTNVVLDGFKNFGDELKKVNENLTTLNNRVGSIENLQKDAIKESKEIRNQQEETNKRLEVLEVMEKSQKKMIKQLRDINNAINNLAESVEDRAREFPNS